MMINYLIVYTCVSQIIGEIKDVFNQKEKANGRELLIFTWALIYINLNSDEQASHPPPPEPGRCIPTPAAAQRHEQGRHTRRGCQSRLHGCTLRACATVRLLATAAAVAWTTGASEHGTSVIVEERIRFLELCSMVCGQNSCFCTLYFYNIIIHLLLSIRNLDAIF
jgi:hypothetical protein